MLQSQLHGTATMLEDGILWIMNLCSQAMVIHTCLQSNLVLLREELCFLHWGISSWGYHYIQSQTMGFYHFLEPRTPVSLLVAQTIILHTYCSWVFPFMPCHCWWCTNLYPCKPDSSRSELIYIDYIVWYNESSLSYIIPLWCPMVSASRTSLWNEV